MAHGGSIATSAVTVPPPAVSAALAARAASPLSPDGDASVTISGGEMGAKDPPLAVIAGPTGSGKSAVATALAERRGGVIINADASQLYRPLRILSARPTPDDERRVPHRLYGMLPGDSACSAARWAAAARDEIARAWTDGRLPILVGGTGLYLRTLLDGIAPVPAIDPAVRRAVRALPPADVRHALEREDPVMAARLAPGDPQRNARALEVWRSTGRSLAHWQAAPRTGGLSGEVALEPLVLELGRETLAARLAGRIETMWAQGALEEVRVLMTLGLPSDAPILKAIGVPPLAALLAGRIDRAAALERWFLDTRRYAKRQATFFRHQMPDWPRLTVSGGAPTSPPT